MLIAKISYSPRDQHTYNKIWLKLNENWGSNSLFENLNIENFEKCTEWPQTKLKESGVKGTCTPPMCTVVPRVPNFRPFGSTVIRFQDIAQFGIFLLTPVLKFQSAIKCLHFGRSPIYTITFYSLMTTLFIIKFGSDLMKTGGVAF